ncbi:MAG: N-acetylglucosamine-6-phosphate deacetylase [Solirubrobacteraceae bacterium]
MRLRSERIVTSSGTIAGELLLRDGVIWSIEPARPDGEGREPIDVDAAWIVPGYIDTHVHGGGGAQCNTADPDEIAAVASFHAAHGTTALLATTVAAPVDELVLALQAIARAGEHDRPGEAAVLGAHLEGPFLSKLRPGAMDADAFIDPDAQIVERLLRAGAGAVQWMTVAPELTGGLDLVRTLATRGVVASIGHTDATYDQTVEAVSAGVRAATHVFNAMPPLHHREPGALGAVLDLPEISAELICDGVHVSPAALRLVRRVKGDERVRLVTDAIQAAGMPDGDYRLGAAEVTVTDGRATLREGGSIAGSTLTMQDAVRNAVHLLGAAVEEAIVLACTNPARMLGLERRKGAIAVGLDADLALLDEDLRVRGTLVGGRWVSRPPPPGRDAR